MDKKFDIIPPPIKEDLEELFGYLWHLGNPIEAIRIADINGIEDFHKQLHVLNNSLHKLIIHIRHLLTDSNYLIDNLKQGFNINNLTKIDSGVHSLDSINQVSFPIIEGSHVDLSESTRWSESQVKNFKYFLNGESSFARKLSQQFDINRTALEKYLERFRNDIAEHIKNFDVISSSLETSTETLEKPRTSEGTQVKNNQDKIKVLIRNMYEEDKEKIDQEAIDKRKKIIEEMSSRGRLYSGVTIGRLKKVELDRIESLWKKRIEIEIQARQEDINENTSQEILNEVSNIIRGEIEMAKARLLKSTQYSGALCKSLLEELTKKEGKFIKASKRRIDIEIGQKALFKKGISISKEKKKEINQFLKTRFGYNIRKLSNKLRTISDEQIRSIINKDIKIAVSCLMFKLWKPCVILCGGVIEGILGDKISTRPKPAITQAYKKSYPGKKLKRSNKYTLENFVDVAFELEIIEKGTRDFAHGVRDYRNYIHPSKEANQKHSITERDAIIACQTVFKIIDEI